jgi:hypothetical protein
MIQRRSSANVISTTASTNTSTHRSLSFPHCERRVSPLSPFEGHQSIMSSSPSSPPSQVTSNPVSSPRAAPPPALELEELGPREAGIIRAADTFFIASGSGAEASGSVGS